ncbi:hypothetical protein CEXT_804191 [Caerostris extrusa]|uniref:Uncharacterized protein n=1 Tax=Caerostris extrusa TaxID=172846 RepID=A0AAV4N474_CAEEX|nr:hypothetical protein CEXT_804191 [Caerostris extrusa]
MNVNSVFVKQTALGLSRALTLAQTDSCTREQTHRTEKEEKKIENKNHRWFPAEMRFLNNKFLEGVGEAVKVGVLLFQVWVVWNWGESSTMTIVKWSYVN